MAEPRKEQSSGSMISEKLFKARTILIFGEISQTLARDVCAQLLAMSADSKDAIRVFVSSPGGHVESGDAIHDMIRFVRAPVTIIGTGWVASAGAHIFLAAPKERRMCLQNTRFLLHQPSGGLSGQAADIDIEAREILKMRERLNRIISEQTGQSIARIEKDTDRNFWMSAEEAKEYGVVGKILQTADEV
jgi:ATP-dependent Clp protease, protease subunit